MGIANRRLLRLMAPGLVALLALSAAASSSEAQSPGPLTPDDLSFDGQLEGRSSPTFAASPQGSPYSAVYSRTFGASGTRPTAPSTGQPGQAAPAQPAAGSSAVIYVIDSNGLLTYRKEDYASGSGAAVARNPLPANTASTAGPMAPAQVPTVADNLYRQPPLETAAGPPAANFQPADLGAAAPQ